mgnify:CR=1 FL=1
MLHPTSFQVSVPGFYDREREYALHIVLDGFLGLAYELHFAEGAIGTVIRGEDEKELHIADAFFSTEPEKWLKPGSLPVKPLTQWDVKGAGLEADTISSKIPMLYTEDPGQSAFFRASDGCGRLGLDIFGSVFFMLSRYEELVKPDRDEHGRFPATASLAYQEGFLNRPIVNEYVEILWAAMNRLWPGLKRKRRTFKIVPTHDVDMPYEERFRPFSRAALRAGVDIVRRRSPRLAVQNLMRWERVRRGTIKDRYDTFDWLMDQSEKCSVKSAFYFMGAQKGRKDSGYRLEHPKLQSVIQSIQDRGHAIGFHPGYNTYSRKHEWQQQLAGLQDALPDHAALHGGRQHFLRLEVPTTWRLWAESGLDYDSTLGFADHPGFRCGTCYPFPVFDLEKREQLPLFERPLIAMDCTVLHPKYMGLVTSDEALQTFVDLRERCRLFNGEFVFLWHNSSLTTAAERDLYVQLLQS